MNVSAAGPVMDKATMQTLLNGATAAKQVSQAQSQQAQVPTDAVTLALSAKVLDTARGGLDVYA